MSAHDEWDITCFHPLPFSKFVWVIMNLSTAFVYVFGIYLIYLTWAKMDKTTYMCELPIIKLLCTTIVVLLMSSSLQWSIHVTSSFYCLYKDDLQTWLNLGLIGLLSYQLALALLYLVFVIRLQFVFKGTKLAPPFCISSLFILGLLLQIALAIIVMYIYYSLPPQQWKWAFYSVNAFHVTNLIFTIILLTVFFKKIKHLSNDNRHAINLIKSAKRLVICASIGLLSSNIASSTSFIRIFDDGEVTWTADVMTKSLDQCINILSLYLSFPFGKRVYNSLFVAPTHIEMTATVSTNATVGTRTSRAVDVVDVTTFIPTIDPSTAIDTAVTN